jgi:hypothetical protein
MAAVQPRPMRSDGVASVYVEQRDRIMLYPGIFYCYFCLRLLFYVLNSVLVYIIDLINPSKVSGYIYIFSL